MKARILALVAALLVYATAPLGMACGATFADLEDAAAKGDTDAQLKLCRAEARAAFYVEKKTEAEALERFDACVKRTVR